MAGPKPLKDAIVYDESLYDRGGPPMAMAHRQSAMEYNSPMLSSAQPVGLSGSSGFISANTVKVRKEFPETWIWHDIVDTGYVKVFYLFFINQIQLFQFNNFNFF